jgi:methanol--5-hydroxybenzimidazolylcobamide Co-methyltransferase
MNLSSAMAYGRAEEMIFGTAKKPVETKRGLTIGGGYVIPELNPHPRSGSEKTKKTLLREFERANGDALERCVSVGHPRIVIENEHVFQMTDDPEWGGGSQPKQFIKWTNIKRNTGSRRLTGRPLPIFANRTWFT